MSTTKLIVDYDYDFHLIGVIGQLKEYKLAWYVNDLFDLELFKNEDLEYEFLKGDSMLISNYFFQKEYDSVRLLKNRAIESENMSKPFLIPEMKDFDFFLQIEGESDLEDLIPNLEDTLKSIPNILYVSQIDVEHLKSRDNLIY